MNEPISYTITGAAAATGLSVNSIRQAIRSGALTAIYPPINGKPSAKALITRVELERWLSDAVTHFERTP